MVVPMMARLVSGGGLSVFLWRHSPWPATSPAIHSPRATTAPCPHDSLGVTPRNGKDRTLRANDGGGKQPGRRGPLETRRFSAVSPRFEARRKAHVSRR